MKHILKYYLAYKPYGMLTQFTDEQGRKTLADLFPFPKDVYPVGRLDMDSEGLVLLTNDKKLNHMLLNPKFAHEREYLVQVEGVPSKEAIKKLCDGVLIENKLTLPAKVKLVDPPKNIPERTPPIRERKNIPTSWLSISLIEGRNRQVRKMTASVGYPTLRLIRIRIENQLLKDLKPGEVREIKTPAISVKGKQF
ncbi:MAG: pseudouridine synthase [Ignavibacteriales bacterium]|nr:MAG: pseudouridine synthase [Ignavibacteriales bacterium]